MTVDPELLGVPSWPHHFMIPRGPPSPPAGLPAQVQRTPCPCTPAQCKRKIAFHRSEWGSPGGREDPKGGRGLGTRFPMGLEAPWLGASPHAAPRRGRRRGSGPPHNSAWLPASAAGVGRAVEGGRQAGASQLQTPDWIGAHKCGAPCRGLEERDSRRSFAKTNALGQ